MPQSSVPPQHVVEMPRSCAEPASTRTFRAPAWGTHSLCQRQMDARCRAGESDLGTSHTCARAVQPPVRHLLLQAASGPFGEDAGREDHVARPRPAASAQASKTVLRKDSVAPLGLVCLQVQKTWGI